jgi:hypothetical protein
MKPRLTWVLALCGLAGAALAQRDEGPQMTNPAPRRAVRAPAASTGTATGEATITTGTIPSPPRTTAPTGTSPQTPP